MYCGNLYCYICVTSRLLNLQLVNSSHGFLCCVGLFCTAGVLVVLVKYLEHFYTTYMHVYIMHLSVVSKYA